MTAVAAARCRAGARAARPDRGSGHEHDLHDRDDVGLAASSAAPASASAARAASSSSSIGDARFVGRHALRDLADTDDDGNAREPGCHERRRLVVEARGGLGIVVGFGVAQLHEAEHREDQHGEHRGTDERGGVLRRQAGSSAARSR